MIRNCTIPLLVACAVAVIQAIYGRDVPQATACAVLLALATLCGISQSRRMRLWANMKTLEICYWIPDIDEIVERKAHSSRQPRRRSQDSAG
jgi:disulfide bond formation protein DsbB